MTGWPVLWLCQIAAARALRMDDTERAHLYDLARAAGTSPRRRRKPADPQGVRPNVQRLLDAMTDTPALVINGRTDVLASNALGRALFAPLHDTTTRPPNHARFIFLNARSHDFWDNWDHAADDAVALLHTQAGRHSFDTDLTALIGELSTRSEDFHTRWARHDVRRHATGVKHLRHPAISTLHLTFEAMELVADKPPGRPPAISGARFPLSTRPEQSAWARPAHRESTLS
ncbi:hypothetical protein ABZT28_35610 [Streptomyces sp. NPDC005388]|uniref:MmyB family transcriptional regulator n=1 Tax=Streptomyces sp. NPDC005388 TaxID=3156717 RepID=UPI0033B8C9F8